MYAQQQDDKSNENVCAAMLNYIWKHETKPNKKRKRWHMLKCGCNPASRRTNQLIALAVEPICPTTQRWPVHHPQLVSSVTAAKFCYSDPKDPPENETTFEQQTFEKPKLKRNVVTCFGRDEGLRKKSVIERHLFNLFLSLVQAACEKYFYLDVWIFIFYFWMATGSTICKVWQDRKLWPIL